MIMYCVTYWYDWDGIVCAPNGDFCFLESPKEAKKMLLRLITEHAKNREYEVDMKETLKNVKYEGEVCYKISASELFNDENDYSRFKIQCAKPGEIISLV